MIALQPDAARAYSALRRALEQRGATVRDVGFDEPLPVPVGDRQGEPRESLNDRHAYASFFGGGNCLYIGQGQGSNAEGKPPGWAPDADARLQSLLHEAMHLFQHSSPLAALFQLPVIPLAGTETAEGVFMTDGRSASEASAILAEALAYEAITGRPGDFSPEVCAVALGLPDAVTHLTVGAALQLTAWATERDREAVIEHVSALLDAKLAQPAA